MSDSPLPHPPPPCGGFRLTKFKKIAGSLMGCNAHLLIKSRAVFKLWASHQNLVSTEGKDDNIVTQIRNEWTIGVSLS